MKKWFTFVVILIQFSAAIPSYGEGHLFIFAGVASKPATEEAAKAFEKKMGAKVDITFGGSGFLLAQMKLGQQGDIYFPACSDFMEKAKDEGLVRADTERIVAYLIPAIIVQKDNPKGIKGLKDLTRSGLRLAIANPETVCVGTYAAEIIEKNLSIKERALFKRNLVNYTESVEKTVNVVSLKAVDAAIGWWDYQYSGPERIQTILLQPEEISRIGYIPIAVSKFTKNKELAQQFINFLLSKEGKAIYRKYHYLMTLKEAFAFTGKKPVGGVYILPKEWRGR